MQEGVEIKQPTWKEWLILRDLSLCKDTSPTYKKKWAERIGTSYSNPTTAKAFEILRKAGISESLPWIANSKTITINIKKLDSFIEKSDIYKAFRKYVYTKELFVVGV